MRLPERTWPQLIYAGSNVELLPQRGIDGGELGVELAAKAIYRCNDCQRNAGGDQAVFDSRSAAFVLPEFSE
jgi:hypothetical protein